MRNKNKLELVKIASGFYGVNGWTAWSTALWDPIKDLAIIVKGNRKGDFTNGLHKRPFFEDNGIKHFYSRALKRKDTAEERYEYACIGMFRYPTGPYDDDEDLDWLVEQARRYGAKI
jgi:hypothetical protein